jgi:predicted extracellular nuclease
MKKLVSLLVLVLSVNAMATMQITEWMYKGAKAYTNTAGKSVEGEFIEFTNLGSTAIDMTGWSFDDDSAIAGTVSLGAFGIVAAGESVILTEASASSFRTAWGLNSSVKIIGDLTTNLGKVDGINLYNSANTLVDSLNYPDADPKTVNKSCTIPSADLALTTASSSWALALDDDIFGSVSKSGDVANPGYYYAVPEPATLFILGAAAMVLRLRKR